MSAGVFVATMLLVWGLCALMLATWGESNRGSVFYPGKMNGERGIMTTLRWSFHVVLAPLLTSLLLAYIVAIVVIALSRHAPDGLKNLYKWMKEEG